MIERKKKIKIIQVTLLLIGMLIIFFTYIKKENISEDKIITSEAQKKNKATNGKSVRARYFLQY